MLSDSIIYFVVQVPRIDIDDVTSKLLHCAWAGALEAAKEFADLDDPLVTWSRKGDDELRKLAVAIAIDVYTTLRVLNSNFKIPPATSPIIGYLAIASWMVFAFHRRAALDDSMRARPSGKRGATDVIGEERVLRPRSQGFPVTCMKIVMAYLLVQCHDDEISEIDTQQLRVFEDSSVFEHLGHGATGHLSVASGSSVWSGAGCPCPFWNLCGARACWSPRLCH